MPTNNFKLFDENKANMMTDQEYNIAQQRLNGVQSGVASSQLQNKTLYQTALMCYALAQLMAANGYDANDADAVSTFVNNLSSTVMQKVADKATESEATAGTVDNKYISPTTLKAVKPKYGANDPTAMTVGFLGQIYINTTTNGAYLCVEVNDDGYTWEKIPNYQQVTKTEIITLTQDWTVPNGIIGDVAVRIFGGGACGGGHMATGNYTLNVGDKIPIVIGSGATYKGNGGASSFGSYLTAQGASGLNGGSGGGGNGGSSGSDGGNASYGGGGGGGSASSSSGNGGDGGAGGTYGGGGGGGAGNGSSSTRGTGGVGGTYGGSGGLGGYSGTSGSKGSNGTNTIGLGLEFEGEGKAGSSGTYSSRGGGGGGGYGGNGGDNSVNNGYGGGGGGGYGGNGGASLSYDYRGGGGGGGYGSDGGNPDHNYGGGGGGYGINGRGVDGNSSRDGAFAAGVGGSTNSNIGGSGVCIINYTVLEVM